jgi:Flp pilus assembly protein TadG
MPAKISFTSNCSISTFTNTTSIRCSSSNLNNASPRGYCPLVSGCGATENQWVPSITVVSRSSLITARPAVEWDTLGMFRILAKYSRRRARDIARFYFARQGATAVEFALIAPAFLGTLIAVFETTLFLFAQQAMQNAALQASRVFMTGSAQSGGMTQTQFQNSICPLIQPLLTCSALMVDVQNYSSFSSANTSTPTLTYNAQGQVTNSWSYSPGNPGDVMVVRLVYQWKTVGGPLGFVLSNLPNNMAEVMGVAAFRVEPYG